jgi:membrane-associated phospholipid phosphatase
MKVKPVTFLFLAWALPAWSQEPAPSPAPDDAQHSKIEVQHGPEAIQRQDLFEGTGYLHPLKRLPGFVLHDQKAIWTSPFHTSKRDARWWALFGGATGLLIAFDEQIQKKAPNPGWLVTLGTNGSYLGAAYSLIPLSAGFYLIGSKAGDERFREAGLMSFEALIDSTIVEETFKVITDRERPLEGTGEGRFFHSTDRLNSGFPSGHSINTFALASVFAHEYHEKLWVKIVAYAYAGSVAGARLAANRHFPSDTLAGGAMGWFIGDYIYNKRHNSDLDRRAGLAKRVLAHVRVGGGTF